jgi:excisionase family DNA binding protein
MRYSNSANPKLITLKEFGDRIGVSYSTVRRMVRAKAVRVVTPHRRSMIPETEVTRHTAPLS